MDIIMLHARIEWIQYFILNWKSSRLVLFVMIEWTPMAMFISYAYFVFWKRCINLDI